MCTEFGENVLSGYLGEYFLNLSKYLTVQQNLSRRTLWVQEAKMFSLQNKAYIPNFWNVRQSRGPGWAFDFDHEL